MQIYFSFAGTFEVKEVKSLPPDMEVEHSVNLASGGYVEIYSAPDGRRFITESYNGDPAPVYEILDRVTNAFVPDCPAKYTE